MDCYGINCEQKEKKNNQGGQVCKGGATQRRSQLNKNKLLGYTARFYKRITRRFWLLHFHCGDVASNPPSTAKTPSFGAENGRRHLVSKKKSGSLIWELTFFMGIVASLTRVCARYIRDM